MMDFTEKLDAKMAAKERHDSKMHDRLMAKEERAEKMIGELCREGRTVYYVFPVGGKYREGTYASLIRFLLRNRYI